MNGEKVKSWTTAFPFRQLKKKVDEYLYIGMGDQKEFNNFALAYFNIFPKPLTSDEVKVLFETSKSKAFKDKSFNLRELENKFAEVNHLEKAIISSITGASNTNPLPNNLFIMGTMLTKSTTDPNTMSLLGKPQPMTSIVEEVILDNTLYYWLDMNKKLTNILNFNGDQYMPFTTKPTSSYGKFTVCFWYKIRAPTFDEISTMYSADEQNEHFLKIKDILNKHPNWNNWCKVNFNDPEFVQAWINAWIGKRPSNVAMFTDDNSPLFTLATPDKMLSIYVWGRDLKIWTYWKDNYGLIKAGTDNHWHHFALVMNDADTTYKIYNNGGLMYMTSGESAFPNLNEFDRMFLGTDVKEQKYNNKFRGKVSDVHIYDKALTQQEIVRVMNSLPNAS